MIHDRAFQTPPPGRDSVDAEEQRAWVAFYKRVGHDAALAAEVLGQLDGDAEMKRRHLALYLSCRQSVRLHKARQVRNKRIGHWLRLLVRTTLLQPVAVATAAVRGVVKGSRDLLVELIATATATASNAEASKRSTRISRAAEEPATPQVRKLLKDAEFADAHSRFQQQDGVPVATGPGQQPDSADQGAVSSVRPVAGSRRAARSCARAVNQTSSCGVRARPAEAPAINRVTSRSISQRRKRVSSERSQ